LKSFKNIYFLFAAAFVFHSSGNAWILGTSKVNGSPPKEYCVSPGWFNNNPYKCVPYEDAQTLDKDYSSVYAAASSGDPKQYIKAQADIDKGKAKTEELRTQLTTLNKNMAQVKEDMNAWQSPEKMAELKRKKDQIQADIDRVQAQAQEAQRSLSTAETGPDMTSGAQRLEVSRKGLLTQVNDIQNKLTTLEDNLRNTEQELNNTVLEAFVVSKIDRLAASLCEVSNNKMCEKDPASVRKFLLEKVASEKLRTNFKGTAPAPAPAAAPTGK
jgi:DNA repair exonuclease SbcCD ATPase subunit